MSAPEKPPLVVIAGPTGAGKSALAIEWAGRSGATIVNADASQLYRDLRVLTARPSAEDEARVPHRLYGVVDGAEPASAAWWAARVGEILRAESAASGVRAAAIVVGGTGLYLRALLDGIAPVPAIDAGVRAGVRAMDAGAAHAALAREDPGGAARLNAADPQRVKRALEVVRSTGRPLAAWQARREGGIATAFAVRGYVVDVERDVLAVRLATRLDAMLAGGALDEVRALMERGLSAELPVMKAVGVAPLIGFLRGRGSLADARETILRQTMQLVKRQRTWFRNQTPGWTRRGS